MIRLLIAAGLTCAMTLGQGQVSPRMQAGGLDRVPPVLRMAVRAMQNLRYSGTRTVDFLDGANRTQHTEYVLRDGRRVRVWFPNSSPFAGQVIVEDGQRRKHYFPGRNEIQVGPPKREEAFGRLLSMIREGSLAFSTEPGGSLAGQRAIAVTVRRGQNLLQKLWIDARTGMVLKRDLFDPVGRRVGSYEFTEINYTPKVDDTDFRLSVAGAREVTPRDEARKIAEKMGLALVILPESEGYVLESARIMKAARIPMLHLAYIKPGAALSLFQAKGVVDVPLGKRAAKGGVAAVSWQMNGNTYALLGNAGEEELRRLARVIGMR